MSLSSLIISMWTFTALPKSRVMQPHWQQKPKLLVFWAVWQDPYPVCERKQIFPRIKATAWALMFFRWRKVDWTSLHLIYKIQVTLTPRLGYWFYVGGQPTNAILTNTKEGHLSVVYIWRYAALFCQVRRSISTHYTMLPK